MNGPRVKLVVIGFITLAAVALAWHRAQPAGRLSADINFVCAATGKTFRLGRHEVTRIPARSPTTGEFTLFPCFMSEGVLQVSARHAGGLADLGEKNRYVDPGTLAVRPPP